MKADNTEHWSRVLPYLDEALQLDAGARDSWFATLGSSQPALAAELQELLALHAQNRASGFLERSPLASDDALIGKPIGAYTVERALGRGGMGTVWLARRSDGKFEGRVAIKLLDRRGLGPGAANQIRQEASLLARLSHPNIARLFDAGVRENGQPYLILEYVEGESIDRYCRDRQLSLHERLRLALRVLDAVAHAHAQLIVHRDLKPSNVLVTTEGLVKLLDFGIASLQQPATAAALPAEPQALTPGYAAPEQLRGDPVSAATDVYALGVLLHVLITGEHPYGSGTSTHTRLARATLTEDAEPASGHLPKRAQRRQVRGDLDAIVSRALSREAAGRYATAAELASDIRAFLDGFPVKARPATRAYVAHKFAQRHWGGVLAGGLILLVLAGASVITTLQLREVRRQRDFARTQLARAEALNELNVYVLQDAAPAGKPFTVNELLGRAAHLLERQAATDANRVALLTSIGQQFALQDQDQVALRLLNEAYRLSRAIPDVSVRARAACALAGALSKGQDSVRPEALIAEAFTVLPAEAEYALDRSLCLSSGGLVATNRGDAQLAIRRSEDAVRELKQVPFGHQLAGLKADADLAEAYRGAGRFREALAVYEKAWPQLVALGRDDTIVAVAWLNNWGLDLCELGRPLEAEALLHRSIEIHRADASEDAVSPMLLTNYAQQLYDLGRADEAADYAERAYRGAQRAGDQIVINQTLLRLARIYRGRGELPRATQMLDQVEPRLQKALPPGHYAFATLASERSLIAQADGDLPRALQLSQRAVEILQRAAQNGKAGAQFLPMFLTRRASIASDMGDLSAAEQDARRALALLAQGAPPGEVSSFVGEGYLVLAHTLNAAGRGTEARSDAQLAAEHLRKTLGPNHPDTRAAEALSAGHDPLRRADGAPLAQGTAAAAPISPQAANSSVMRSGEALSL
jgi:serine/threonine-protein kinase